MFVINALLVNGGFRSMDSCQFIVKLIVRSTHPTILMSDIWSLISDYCT
jgi:hypothetical protein